MPDWIMMLPHWQAGLNATAALLVAGGYWAIRRGMPQRHRLLMILALLVSTGFLASYATYHVWVGNVKFAGEGIIRPVYFTLLISHVLLAAIGLPLILTAAFRALRGQSASHRSVARWALPVWLYVSVSGLVVYWLAFHRYPPLLAS